MVLVVLAEDMLHLGTDTAQVSGTAAKGDNAFSGFFRTLPGDVVTRQEYVAQQDFDHAPAGGHLLFCREFGQNGHQVVHGTVQEFCGQFQAFFAGLFLLHLFCRGLTHAGGPLHDQVHG